MTESSDRRRSHSPAKLNLAANYTSFLISLFTGFISSPLLLGYLGSQAFGSWRFATRVLDVASVADGQGAQALKWWIATRRSDPDEAMKQRLVGAGLRVWMRWLPLLLATGLGITILMPIVLDPAHPLDHLTVYLMSGILSLNLVASGVAALPDSVLVGINQGYRSMFVTSMVVLVSSFLMIAVARVGGGLVGLSVVVLMGTAANGLLTLWIAKRHVPWLGIAKPLDTEVKRLSSFTGWVFAWSLLGRLLMSTEPILIGVLIGPDEVSNYTFTAYVSTAALGLTQLTASAFMPSLSIHLGRGELSRARDLVEDVRHATMAIAVVVGAVSLLFNRSFVSIWAGDGSFLGVVPQLLIVLAFFQVALIRTDAQILEAGLNARARGIVGAVGVALSVGLATGLYLLTTSITYLFAGLIVGRMIPATLFPLLVRKSITLPLKPSWRVTVSAGILLAAFLGGIDLRIDSVIVLFASAIAATASIVVISYFAVLPKATRGRMAPAFALQKRRRF